jgi:hypothetical protein
VGRGGPALFVSVNAVSSHHDPPGAQPAPQQAHKFHEACHLGGEFDFRHRPAVD